MFSFSSNLLPLKTEDKLSGNEPVQLGLKLVVSSRMFTSSSVINRPDQICGDGVCSASENCGASDLWGGERARYARSEINLVRLSLRPTAPRSADLCEGPALRLWLQLKGSGLSGLTGRMMFLQPLTWQKSLIGMSPRPQNSGQLQFSGASRCRAEDDTMETSRTGAGREHILLIAWNVGFFSFFLFGLRERNEAIQGN